MPNRLDEFRSFREETNARLLAENQKLIKRIYSLDSQAYEPGVLDAKTKELLGLVASAVLRCDDCVSYHLQGARDRGATKEEVLETLGIATLVGGTIVIPHLRRAYAFWESLEQEAQDQAAEKPEE